MGATYELAAQYGGISYVTFNTWQKRGQKELERVEAAGKGAAIREKERLFVDFYRATKKAEAEAAIMWLALIEKAANEGTWQAAAWKLERRYPHRYGKTVTEHHGSGPGQAIPITFIAVPPKPEKQERA